MHNCCKIQKEDDQGPIIAHPTIHSLIEYESSRSLNDWLQKVRQNLQVEDVLEGQIPPIQSVWGSKSAYKKSYIRRHLTLILWLDGHLRPKWARTNKYKVLFEDIILFGRSVNNH